MGMTALRVMLLLVGHREVDFWGGGWVYKAREMEWDLERGERERERVSVCLCLVLFVAFLLLFFIKKIRLKTLGVFSV